MVTKHYPWVEGDIPPAIQQHSIAKHEVLKTYLIAYIQTLAASPHREELRLTLIDGFSGGGLYTHQDTKKIVLGSPFIMLESISEADFRINGRSNRIKPLRLDVNFIFIEKNKKTLNYLRNRLIEKHYKPLLENDKITLLNTTFDKTVDKIINAVRTKSPRSGRCIFLLDQYGYKDVPTKLIRNILSSLPNSEVILTFATDALVNFISDKEESQKMLRNIGISGFFDDFSIKTIKQKDKEWRLFIQSKLHQELVINCGARFFTPFFIRSSQGFGDYWLVHLSQHPKARDVMTGIHWSLQNHFIHFGGAGLDMFQMLGYVPEEDYNFSGQKLISSFEFDDLAKKRSLSALSNQLPRLINNYKNGIEFKELFASTCNHSPASSEVYKESLVFSQNEKEIEIITPSGNKRRSSNGIKDTDIIRPTIQRTIVFA